MYHARLKRRTVRRHVSAGAQRQTAGQGLQRPRHAHTHRQIAACCLPGSLKPAARTDQRRTGAAPAVPGKLHAVGGKDSRKTVVGAVADIQGRRLTGGQHVRADTETLRRIAAGRCRLAVAVGRLVPPAWVGGFGVDTDPHRGRDMNALLPRGQAVLHIEHRGTRRAAVALAVSLRCAGPAHRAAGRGAGVIRRRHGDADAAVRAGPPRAKIVHMDLAKAQLCPSRGLVELHLIGDINRRIPPVVDMQIDAQLRQILSPHIYEIHPCPRCTGFQLPGAAKLQALLHDDVCHMQHPVQTGKPALLGSVDPELPSG